MYTWRHVMYQLQRYRWRYRYNYFYYFMTSSLVLEAIQAEKIAHFTVQLSFCHSRCVCMYMYVQCWISNSVVTEKTRMTRELLKKYCNSNCYIFHYYNLHINTCICIYTYALLPSKTFSCFNLFISRETFHSSHKPRW